MAERVSTTLGARQGRGLSPDLLPQLRVFSPIPERLRATRYPIHFEAGIHGTPKENDDNLKQARATGDTTVHGWNKEVGERLSFYRPKILTVDGSYFVNDGAYNPSFAWFSLPDAPSKILGNDSEPLYLVSSDQLTSNAFLKYEEQVARTSAERTVALELSNLLHRDELGTRELDELPSEAEVLLHLGGFVVGGLAASAALMRSERASTHTRRNILRMFSLAALGVSLWSAYGAFDDYLTYKRIMDKYDFNDSTKESLEDQISKAKIPQEHQGLVEQYDKAYPDGNKPWLEARNALYVLKTIGAYQQLGLEADTPSAIIAGNDHQRGMTQLLNNPDRAAEVLKNYVSGLFEVIDVYYAQQQKDGIQTQLSPDQAKRLLVDFISLTSIHEARDIDETLFKTDPDKAAAEAIVTKYTYTDTRVQQALEEYFTQK